MEIYDKLIKPIKEVNYLRVENVDRYRIIIRYFFREYERINYWLYKEDIYKIMMETGRYPEYTLEQCQNDLQSLVDWGNLTARQDSNKVKTIEDFKNKKYRYQLNEYTVEIERMTLRLEKLEVEGASLEPTLLERIYNSLLEIDKMKSLDGYQIYGWFNSLMNDFIRLNQNYQDYIKTLNSAKAEELMKTTEFLIFKDKLVSYLRTFVIVIQEKGTLITYLLNNIKKENIEHLLFESAKYELTIPRLDIELEFEKVYENFQSKWTNLYYWFVGKNDRSEVDYLYDMTNEIIRKMTRYAQQIVEMNNRGSNRKEQYIYLAKIFGNCKSLVEAHKLSAFVFGVEDCIHLDHIQPRLSDDINNGVFNEPPSSIQFDIHSRIIRKKYVRKPANDYSLDRIMKKLEIEEEIEKEKKQIEELKVNNIIDFSSLPIVSTNVRQKLLSWLSKGLSQVNMTAKNDYGEMYSIDKSNADQTCILKCEDGQFHMPSFKIVFKE